MADARDFSMLYSDFKIYGPYVGNDGRLRIRYRKDGIYYTISYPKFLMERHLGRYLDKNEVVHHKDENPLNNELSNLIVVTRSAHPGLHQIKDNKCEFICPWCNISFILSGKKLNDAIQNGRRGKHGPFCSRSCAGKWSTQ